MEYTIPHYFEQFHCAASACTDTCCAGWAIMVDETSLEKYEKLEGAFGNRVKNSIDWREGCFHQCEKRCVFLNEENLCDMQIEGGEELLCDTCRNYPRHMEEFEGLREASLSLSCIEAAKLVLGCKEPVQFLTLQDENEEEEFEDFDFLLFTKLMDAREVIWRLLQNRDIDIRMRMSIVLNLASELQEAVERDEIFSMDEIISEFTGIPALLEFQNYARQSGLKEVEYCSMKRKLFRTFSKLEVLQEDWPKYVRKAERALFGEGQRAYEAHWKKFHKNIGLEGEQYEEWACYLEQLMVYFIFTYFCGAVYDDNILGKMKIAVVSTLLIQELAFARWIEQGERLNFMDLVDVAHRFSREIEHSDVNLGRLEKLFEKKSFFQTEQLMRMILY